MSRDNIDVVRHAYERINATYSDAPPALELFDPGVELVQTGELLDTDRTFQGYEGIRIARQELLDSFEKARWDPVQFYEVPDGRVLVLVRMSARGRGSGVELDVQVGHVWTLSEGKIVRWTNHVPAAGAFREAGLPAPQSLT